MRFHKIVALMVAFPISTWSCSDRDANKKTAVCVYEYVAPWFDYSSEYNPGGVAVGFPAANSTAKTILDVFDPLASRVCVSGGPSNAIQVALQTAAGIPKSILVREASCTDIFAPKVEVGPGCVSPNLVCNLIPRYWKCRDNIPDANPRPMPFWSRGWWLVAPDPASSVVLKRDGRASVAYHPNPERTIPPQYLLLSELRRTVRVCASGKAVVHLSKDALGATDDAQKNFNADCQLVQANAIWIQPHEVNDGVSGTITFTYNITW